jgi:NAD(P)-dependent dehydrogenase (short-subunit alcohol dehydrogenase family)
MTTSATTRRAPRGLLVTGGTSGIGLAIACRLARTHDPVVLLSRTAGEARGRVEDAFSGRGLAAPALIDGDVADKARLLEVAEQLRAERVDIGTVVASAGIAIRALVLEVEDDAVRSMLDTNLYGVIATFQAFAPLVLAGPNGRFIAVSSMSAIHGQRLRAVYAATKAGVSGLVRALAAEWGPHGATVNAIGPGILRTPLTSGYMDANPDRADAALAHSLVGRLGTVDDVAFAAEYLASPECSFVTGQTIIIDGGMTSGSTWW